MLMHGDFHVAGDGVMPMLLTHSRAQKHRTDSSKGIFVDVFAAAGTSVIGARRNL
ncbi:MAG: hypothetical protein KGK06_14215 [Xanthomonadaceae bacterium]|nr:hypothetical protein [Xanthomonadaceae bacterium]